MDFYLTMGDSRIVTVIVVDSELDNLSSNPV